MGLKIDTKGYLCLFLIYVLDVSPLEGGREERISRVHGNLTGLKPSQLRSLERVYRRRLPPQCLVTLELGRLLAGLSEETGRQIGILVNRRGNIEDVIVGHPKGITLPDLSGERTAVFRLRGLRFIHTHLQGEPLSQEDLTDLSVLRLDALVAVTTAEGMPVPLVYSAHLLPENREHRVWAVDPAVPIDHLPEIDFLAWVQALEDEFQRGHRTVPLKGPQEKAILLSVSRESRVGLEQSMEELKELARSDGLFVVEAIIQRPQRISPATLIGEGKLQELLVKCLQTGVDLIVFDQNLSPGQAAALADRAELRILDRTQLILDIFAQRAHSQEGKIQVELAQLKYLLPRLAKKPLALSRLTGGIGGRGPGETKLEIDRRRVRDRIHLLEKELIQLGRRREQRVARRTKGGVPILSIIGYTNAGKSTLFNLLTRSQFLVEDRLFATLDTATRRLRFPRDREVVITDTVGLIRNLPKDLMAAFRPTFDELKEADLLVHLIDVSNPGFREQIETVEGILSELGLDRIPLLRVFNKEDQVDPGMAAALCQGYGGISISALRPETLRRFFEAVEGILWREKAEGSGKLTKGDSSDISIQNSLHEVGDHDETPPSYH
jgi:GTPase